jgi:hypothetical protein
MDMKENRTITVQKHERCALCKAKKPPYQVARFYSKEKGKEWEYLCAKHFHRRKNVKAFEQALMVLCES